MVIHVVGMFFRGMLRLDASLGVEPVPYIAPMFRAISFKGRECQGGDLIMRVRAACAAGTFQIVGVGSVHDRDARSARGRALWGIHPMGWGYLEGSDSLSDAQTSVANC